MDLLKVSSPSLKKQDHYFPFDALLLQRHTKSRIVKVDTVEYAIEYSLEFRGNGIIFSRCYSGVGLLLFKEKKYNFSSVRTYYNSKGKVEGKEYRVWGELHDLNFPARVVYYDSGKLRAEEYFVNDEYHRESGPALIYYLVNGNRFIESYYKNGKRHNENGPAVIQYIENPQEGAKEIKFSEYFLIEGGVPKKGPHIIYYFKSGKRSREEYWNDQNQLHRTNGPAVVIYDKRGYLIEEQYWINGRGFYFLSSLIPFKNLLRYISN